MEFDRTKVFTAVNAEEVKVGSKGFFADTLATLVNRVRLEEPSELFGINNSSSMHRFKSSANFDWNLFYKVEEPVEEMCTHRELSRWLASGNGELKFVKDELIATSYHYLVGNENTPVKEFNYKVRRWGDNEWYAPTRTYMRLNK